MWQHFQAFLKLHNKKTYEQQKDGENQSPPDGGGWREHRAPWWNNVFTLHLFSARVAAQGSKGIESKASLGQRPPRLRRPPSPPSVYERQSAASRASATAGRLHATHRQPSVADRSHAYVHIHGCLQRRGERDPRRGGVEDRCQVPACPEDHT